MKFIAMYTRWLQSGRREILLRLGKTYSTTRLPKVRWPLDVDKGAACSTNGMSTQSQDGKLPTLDKNKVRLLRNIKSLSYLEGVEAIILAQILG